MKMKKLGNQGFALVETLIVTAFVMSIFAILYNNFYPLMGEYEKRETYDDIDGKYAVYWVKRIIQHPSVQFSDEQLGSIETNGYFKFSCEMVPNDSMKNMCLQFIDKAQVRIDDGDNSPNIYITEYNLTNFKEKIDNSNSFSGGMHKYIKYLPKYKVPSLNNAHYRVIVEFNRTRDDNNYFAYSTIEVIK